MPPTGGSFRQAKLQDGRCLKLLNWEVKSEDEFRDWMADQDAWLDEVFSEIETNFSRPQAVIFSALGFVLAADIPPSFSPAHKNLKLCLDKRIDSLRNLLDAELGTPQYAWR